MKVLTVVGARPQFIKAFPVSDALAEAHDETLVHTGQHYHRALSEVFFEELDVRPPDHHLGVGSAPPGRQIGRIMAELEPIVEEVDPDVIVAYGDTNSTLAGACVGAHADALLAHVEAGLRSDNRDMPEEINRVLTDHASDLLFAPTDQAVRRLQAEGIAEGVYRTGDVMVDALEFARDIAGDRSQVLDRHGLEPGAYVLATVHRQANTEDSERLRTIFRTLGNLADPVLFPAHPRTVDRLEALGALEWARNQVRLIEPLGYFDFVHALARARRVVTDSGGVQKEAFLLGTPCVTLRAETEWPETVAAGWNTLVGADATAIRKAVDAPVEADTRPPVYGDGTAARAIVSHLQRAVDERIPPEPEGVGASLRNYSRGN